MSVAIGHCGEIWLYNKRNAFRFTFVAFWNLRKKYADVFCAYLYVPGLTTFGRS
ncbi:hypothetical protein CEXT_771521, partial [Caerostris extrusa]